MLDKEFDNFMIPKYVDYVKPLVDKLDDTELSIALIELLKATWDAAIKADRQGAATFRGE